MNFVLTQEPEIHMGGHGLYATVGDYMRFIRCWLKDGAGENGRVLKAETVRIAVKVFLRLSRTPRAQGEKAEGWLYCAAVRIGLDELRRKARRNRYERLAGWFRSVPTPEEIRAVGEERERVRMVLSVMKRRRAELLLLRSDGLSYNEVAAALELNPASVGRLLIRAQEAFRKEYVARYGEK